MFALRSGLTALSLGVLLGALGCEDDGGGINRLGGRLDTELLIDFGDVQVGILAEQALVVTNGGEGNLNVSTARPALTFSAAEYEFKVDGSGFALPPNGTQDVKVSFQPLTEMAEPVESTFTFESDAAAVTVRVKGRGIRSGLIIEPNPVDFGNVLPGSSKNLEIKITNAMSFAVDVYSQAGRSGTPELMITAGTGRFEITTPVESDGSILPGAGKLDPGASTTVTAIYTPDTNSDGRTDRARWIVSSCPSSVCEVDVTLQGRGSNEGLECAPSAVNFGAINPGTVATRMVTCTNVANDALRVVGLELESGAAPAYRLPPATGLPVTLEPTQSINFVVQYVPDVSTLGAGAQVATVAVRGETTMARALQPSRVSLTAETGGPAIQVLPVQLNFGRVAIGTGSTKRLLVENSGYTELQVTMVEADSAATGAFSASTPSFNLAAGTSTIVNVTFRPIQVGAVTSTLIFHSNDSANPDLPVPLSGGGIELPPCNYRATPNPVSFGVVTANSASTQAVRIENLGTDDCLVNDVELLTAPQVPATVFRLVNGNETDILIAPGAFKDLPIEYRPPTGGTDNAYLTFYISNPSAPNPQIPVLGTGEATTEITCPPAVTTPAGAPVTLTVNATTRGTTITGYNWTILSAPTGGIGTPNQWTPNPPRAATEVFLPYIVGTYAVQVTVTDNTGATDTCAIPVIAEGHGLRATMSWDGTGDVDLHVTNSTSQPWFSSPSDCYYSNQSPIWDPVYAASTGPNPDLDFDNTSSFGPENTSIDQPTIGTTYTIGAHNFARSAGRIVTLEIFCGGTVVPTATFISRALIGADAGNCTPNDFWTVATVVFTSATTCTVTPVNTYSTSADRCLAY
ncbi:MAG: choice-of-anchor D domain-containing protein [Deltaproteobacteria bacterium]|nr:choice-of-anchor D domain-containing protein [Deltaproteobacteria bacterium]